MQIWPVHIGLSAACFSLVYNRNEQGKTICEFDGMIIYPNRRCAQIVFLEAKNTKEKPGYAKKCLAKKLQILKIPFDKDAIQINGKDAVLHYDICNTEKACN